MSPQIFFLSAELDAPVGGKATNLARLAALGLSVPPALAISAEAFRAHLSRPSLAALLDDALAHGVDGRADRLTALREGIEREPIDDGLRRELDGALARLGPGPLAVRSSALDEDSATRSFAGQHATLLGVEGAEAVADAVRRCWASTFTTHAVEYREHGGADPRSAAMAVVVQRLVVADVSGVLFTCDPASGRGDRVVVEAVRGLGEALVSGRAVPDRWILDRSTLVVVDRSLAGDAPVLDDPRVVEIARVGLAVERALGVPQDLEFAVEAGELQLLQARPVTTKLAAPDPADRVVWSNSNLGELAPDVSTPMTFSVIQQFVRFLMTPLFQQLRLDVSRLELIGLVGGRVYLNMNSTVALLRSIPGMRRKSYADFFGGDTAALRPALAQLSEADLPPTPRHPLRTLLRLPRLLWWAMRHASLKVDTMMSAMAADTRRLARSDPRAVDDAELLRQLAAYVPDRDDAIAVGFVCVASAQWLAAACRRWLGDVDGAIANQLLSGLGGVDSAEAGLELWRLTAAARALGLQDALAAGDSWANLRERLLAHDSGRAFVSRWDEFMERHGHHTRAEIDVAVPRWREQPDYVLHLLRGYLLDPVGRDLVALHEERARNREQLADACRGRLGPLRRRLFDWLYRRACRGMAIRESAKSDFIRRIALMRRDLLDAGRRLVERGVVADVEDVFFLSMAELGEALADGPPRRLSAAIAARRADHARWSALTPPSVVVGRFDPERHAPPPIDPSLRTLRGVSVSPGVVVGPARVILRADDEQRVLPGEILVAPYTDPGWTPYFLSAAAIVIDQGGMLSHGSVVARELGIPAVVNVGPATRMIRTGQRLRVDAQRGEVYILDDPTEEPS
jgi:rifampicin phosphotransferase